MAVVSFLVSLRWLLGALPATYPSSIEKNKFQHLSTMPNWWYPTQAASSTPKFQGSKRTCVFFQDFSIKNLWCEFTTSFSRSLLFDHRYSTAIMEYVSSCQVVELHRIQNFCIITAGLLFNRPRVEMTDDASSLFGNGAKKKSFIACECRRAGLTSFRLVKLSAISR